MSSCCPGEGNVVDTVTVVIVEALERGPTPRLMRDWKTMR